MAHWPLLKQRGLHVTEELWNGDHTLWSSFPQSATQGGQVFAKMRRPSALQKLLAIVDSAQNHGNIKAVVFIDQSMELTYICTIGCNCAPFHRSPLDLSQPLCACSLQRSCNLCTNTNGNGITHEEQLQGLSIIMATRMAMTLSRWFSWTAVPPPEVGRLSCTRHGHAGCCHPQATQCSSH
mmetsp:Transcript_22493/g.53585  ORF Transcript_22493/g.53585 Transcript_22493/m.53585 type:complete len:181 (+) Transcript_22493:358-900(+)